MNLFIEVVIVIAILVLVFIQAKLGRTLICKPKDSRLLFWHRFTAITILILAVGDVTFVEAVRHHISLGMVSTAIFVVHLGFAFFFVFAFFRTFILGLRGKGSHVKWGYTTASACIGMVTTGLYLATLTM